MSKNTDLIYPFMVKQRKVINSITISRLVIHLTQVGGYGAVEIDHSFLQRKISVRTCQTPLPVYLAGTITNNFNGITFIPGLKQIW